MVIAARYRIAGITDVDKLDAFSSYCLLTHGWVLVRCRCQAFHETHWFMPSSNNSGSRPFHFQR
jgi:hypothetical protein